MGRNPGPRIPVRNLESRPLKLLALFLAGSLALAPFPTGRSGSSPSIRPSGDLDQTISAQEPAVAGRAVIEQGHVDIGPRFDGTAAGQGGPGNWLIQIHDSSGPQPVWRNLPDVVLKVADAAKQVVPDDPSYAFLGATPGSDVYVVPQTQQQGVVWAGWNTQDPQVIAAIKRQARLSLTGVQGPGTVMMYLQSGNLGQPQVLWDSRRTGQQDVFMDANAHTHANWVFSTPGIYFLSVEFAAELTDGSTASSKQVLRFAVGSATDPEPGFAQLALASSPAAVPAASADPAGGQLLWAAGGVLLALLLAGLLIGLLRSIVSSRRAKSEVEAVAKLGQQR